MVNNLEIISLKSQEFYPYIAQLAKLRVEFFKYYPYLYEGSVKSEIKYLKSYINCNESIMILAKSINKIIGITTGMPLEFTSLEFQQPFIDYHVNVRDVFYLGESILLPEFRGRKLYTLFLKNFESAAREYGSKITAFAAIQRPTDDPRKPDYYQPLDSIWHHFGYKKYPKLFMYYDWKEVGEKSSSPKKLVFWMKKND